MKVYYDKQWFIERDDGTLIGLSWNESSMIFTQMIRARFWDEVAMRFEDHPQWNQPISKSAMQFTISLSAGSIWRMMKMIFDWSGLTEEKFNQYREEKSAENLRDPTGDGPAFRWSEYDYLGCARVGELCFDLLLRLKDPDDDTSPLVLTFDCYAGGVKYGTEPYAYSRIEPDYPYEDVGGADFPTDCTEYDYHAFQVFAEQEFTKFIAESTENDSHHMYNLSRDLRPLAEKPLHVW